MSKESKADKYLRERNEMMTTLAEAHGEIGELKYLLDKSETARKSITGRIEDFKSDVASALKSITDHVENINSKVRSEMKAIEGICDVIDDWTQLGIEDLPQYVLDVLNQFHELENDYPNCELVITALNQIGWTADYDLGAELYNFRKIGATNEKDA